MEQKVEFANGIASLVAKASIAVGAVLVLIYCTSIGFYPKNIQIGDGLFFIWSTLVFGFVCTVANFIFTSVGFTLYSPLYLALRKIAPLPEIGDFKGYFPIYILGVFTIIISFLSLLVSDMELKWDWMFVISLVASLLMNGFLLSALLEEKKENFRRIFYVVFILMLFIVPFVIIKGFFTNSVNSSMKYLGVREPAVTVYVDQKYKNVVADAINKIESKRHVIIPVGTNYIRLDNVDVLFQGVGEVSYLKISNLDQSTNFSLPSNSIIVKKDLNKIGLSDFSNEMISLHSKRLGELKVGLSPDNLMLTFDSSYGIYEVGEYEVSERFKAILVETFKEILPTLIKNEEQIESIEVIGFTSSEWKKSEDDVDAYKNNIFLSMNRAVEVANALYDSKELIQYGGWLNKKVVIKGMSSSDVLNSKFKRMVSIKIKTRLNKPSQSDS